MGNPDNVLKLEAAEAKLHELKSNTAILGKEAVSAMAAVEGQQQRLTLQRIIAMVIQIFFLFFFFSMRTCPSLAQIWIIGNWSWKIVFSIILILFYLVSIRIYFLFFVFKIINFYVKVEHFVQKV